MGKIKTKRHKLHTPAWATSARKTDDESTKTDLSKIKVIYMIDVIVIYVHNLKSKRQFGY